MKYILILIIVTGCAGTNPALNYIASTSRNLQVVVDKTEQLCNLSVQSLKVAEQDTSDIEKRCDELWRLFEVLQDMQKIAILAAGGEPCEDCTNE